MKIGIATIIFALGLGLAPALASVDVPMTWRSVHIQTDDRGGAELRAAIDANGDLEELEFAIRGRSVAIPANCLNGFVRPYLNGIKIMYGQFYSGEDYWVLEIPYDGTGSVELGSTFNLVFLETKLVWSYQSVQIDDRTWETRDVCEMPPGTLPDPY